MIFGNYRITGNRRSSLKNKKCNIVAVHNIRMGYRCPLYFWPLLLRISLQLLQSVNWNNVVSPPEYSWNWAVLWAAPQSLWKWTGIVAVVPWELCLAEFPFSLCFVGFFSFFDLSVVYQIICPSSQRLKCGNQDNEGSMVWKALMAFSYALE